MWNEDCKGKVKLSLTLIIKHNTMKTYGEIAPLYLTSALDGGECPGETAPVPIG
jgi:hypothetical protein